MYRFLLILILSFTLLYSSVQAKIKVSIAPEFGIMSGTTEYELDITQNFIDDVNFPTPTNVQWHLTSLLEYPLDVATGGFVVGIIPDYDPNAWSLSIGYVTSLNDPSEKMLDSDWEGAEPLFPYTKFSYTESNAEMSMSIIEIEGSYRIVQKQLFDISLFGGIRYQKIDQSMKGIRGWQLGFYDDGDPLNDTTYTFDDDTYDNIEVLTYEIKYYHLFGGFKINVPLNDNLTTALKAGYTRVKFEDIDDHPLRNKLSTADGFGNGFKGGFDLAYNFGSPNSLKRPFINAQAKYLTLEASGSQTQEWYGDDGATPEDDTGYIAYFIPHTIRSTQLNIGFQLGVSF